MENKESYLNSGFITNNYCEEKVFASKKNRVSLFTGQDLQGKNYQWIKKEYRSKSSFKKEFKMLNLLKNNGVRVPQVYKHIEHKNVIIMEYIEGKLLLEYIENCEEKGIKSQYLRTILISLLSWLDDFYNVCFKNNGYIMEDINFRNFIIKNNKIWGLDFEDCIQGRKERDIGRICAFAVSYYPSFSDWKINLVKNFLEISTNYFNLNIKKVEAAYNSELTAIEKRRDLELCAEQKLDLSGIL